MEATMKQFVEMVDGDYFVSGSRILLEGVVQEFLDGHSPETIQQSFPTLKLADVYGSIAFYLDNQPEITAYLQQRRISYETRRQQNISQNQEFRLRLKARQSDISATLRGFFVAQQ